MFRLTLHYTYHPEDGGNPDDFVATGATLSAACQDLLRQVEELFGVDADVSIWEACTEVVRDEVDYQHRDFSMPEQAFDLTIVEDHEVAPRDHTCPLCEMERHAMINTLAPGDEVKWNDPDGGACSRVLCIQEIERKGDVFTITDKDGSVVRGFVSELS